jgi:phosphoglycolate phosphatase-like HAD superfamily hydrolase
MSKLIVFDWNGTILSDTVASWKAANVCLEFFGRSAITLQQYRETFHFPVIHFYKLNGCDVDDVLARKSEANILFQNAYETLAKNCRTRRGAREILTWLKLQNIDCIILSNYITARIEAHLDRLKIAPFFSYVSAHDDDGTTILQSTTKVQRLAGFMTARGYKPADTIIIGDSAEEPDIARHLGLTSIGITEGYITRERLKQAKPDFIVSALAGIKTCLDL